jgi:hypothetical protein
VISYVNARQAGVLLSKLKPRLKLWAKSEGLAEISESVAGSRRALFCSILCFKSASRSASRADTLKMRGESFDADSH